jgi:hypothetical protein
MVWSSSGEDPLTLGAAKRRARDAPAAAGSIDSSDVRQQVQHVLEQERALHRAQLERMERRLESVERQALQSNASARSRHQMLSRGSTRGAGAPYKPADEQHAAIVALGAPEEWTVHEVAVWLRISVGLTEYVSKFVDNAVDGETLLELQPNELFELGVRRGHHPTFLAALQHLRATVAPPYSAARFDAGVPIAQQTTSLPPQQAPAAV